MHELALTQLTDAAAQLPVFRHVGRVSAVTGGMIEVSGLSAVAGHGDQIVIRRRAGAALRGEVLQIKPDALVVLPEGNLEGVALGDRATLEAQASITPGAHWLGRVMDPMGCPLDGRPIMRGSQPQPLNASPVPAAERGLFGERLDTGMNVFNTMLPIVKGQRLGLFAGSGVGKSSLLAHFAREMAADVVVLALIGERGRELAEFVQNVLGPECLKRTVIIAATSDQSPLLRRRCAWTAMAVAEHFRDQGKHVLLLADSLTRFAEAHREVAVAMGELPTMRGYPPSISFELMRLCERAGPGRTGSEGAITAVLSVLVAGSDMEEPVADILRGVLDGHVVLDRAIAERGRYPAIDLVRSVSRSLPDAATAGENELISQARALLSLYEKSQMMIDAGLYEPGRNPDLDRAVAVWADLDAFISAAAPRSIQDSFDKLQLILRKAQSLPGQAAALPERQVL